MDKQQGQIFSNGNKTDKLRYLTDKKQTNIFFMEKKWIKLKHVTDEFYHYEHEICKI